MEIINSQSNLSRTETGEFTQQTSSEMDANSRLLELTLQLLPTLGTKWNLHNLVSMKRQTLNRVLFYDRIYREILDVPGVICEFGVQWGATSAQLINLRGVYEPYNYSRHLFSFDTFEGFTSIDPKDGGLSNTGDYAVSKSHENVLNEILDIHEAFSPITHIRKFTLIKGDASEKIDQWLAENPHAIISLAIFDMDVYKPTKEVLQKILPRLVKGSVLLFDELNCPNFPGETLALDEVLGLNNIRLHKSPLQPFSSWMKFEV
jgi:hypothetical protein